VAESSKHRTESMGFIVILGGVMVSVLDTGPKGSQVQTQPRVTDL
jgi:hypothetical protein